MTGPAPVFHAERALKARVRAATVPEEEIERQLKDWAEWYQLKRLAQGFGAGIDMEGTRIARAPGKHADPVLSEFLAAERDDQGSAKRIHAILLGYDRWWQQVAKARWVGQLEITEWRRVRQIDRIQVAANVNYLFMVVGDVPANPSAFKYSGLQAMKNVAEQLGCPLRTVERTIAQIKRQLPLDIAAVVWEPRLQAQRVSRAPATSGADEDL